MSLPFNILNVMLLDVVLIRGHDATCEILKHVGQASNIESLLLELFVI